LPVIKYAYILSLHRGRLAHILSYPVIVVEFGEIKDSMKK